MQIPPAGIIEMADDDLKNVTFEQKAKQLAEMGTATGIREGMFQQGYQLGLQTARVMLRQSTQLQLKGIKPEDLL